MIRRSSNNSWHFLYTHIRTHKLKKKKDEEEDFTQEIIFTPKIPDESSSENLSSGTETLLLQNPVRVRLPSIQSIENHDRGTDRGIDRYPALKSFETERETSFIRVWSSIDHETSVRVTRDGTPLLDSFLVRESMMPAAKMTNEMAFILAIWLLTTIARDVTSTGQRYTTSPAQDLDNTLQSVPPLGWVSSYCRVINISAPPLFMLIQQELSLDIWNIISIGIFLWIYQYSSL